MELKLVEEFTEKWAHFFPGVELPLAVWYTDTPDGMEQVFPEKGQHCMIAQMNKAREGKAICFGKGSIACGGGNRYCGFSQKLRPGFEYFLSYGNETLEGERYKKSPELVEKWLKNYPPFEAPGKFLAIKRWDLLESNEEPFAVIFLATPDVLSGLFTLANYEDESSNGVICPMGAGCMTVFQVPFFENQKEKPSAILGMFDVSARPSVGANELSFAVPMKRFTQMISNMEESFLITESWVKVQNRITQS
ncbi:MAG: DUF169 domain-containing protein [Bacteroidetes bacterium]|nr:DUF169 domain-containing protein [Bacteroidota bacterium]